ncbi:PA14 domain-containing protein [Hymenobacter norwichensis]|uniref:PA14 domain-containing protein n=1 Tax=Hymenobacter norwichensis TaxID=223903 RepID=UPI0003FA4737|nr:PA14 domain-containing protein [Hymenobacter norwichensis]
MLVGLSSAATLGRAESGDTPGVAVVQGAGTGLTASYFRNGTLAGVPVLTRIDPAIDFQWGAGSPGPEVPADNFSVRWEGLLAAPATGRYKFSVQTSEGVRMWVNGKKVLDTWDGKKNSGEAPLAIANLAAGEKTSIKLEYFDQEGDARIQLQWTPPGQAEQTIPSGNLYPLGSSLAPDPAGANPAVAAKPAPAAKPAAAEVKAPKAVKEPKTAKDAAVAAAPTAKPAATKPAAKPAAEPKPAPAPKSVAAEPKPSPAFVPGVYTLKVRTDEKPLELADQTQVNAAANPLGAAAPSTVPQWSIEPAGTGYYRIAVQGGRKVLEVLGSATSNGTPLSLWPFYSGNNQLWAIEPLEDGYYKLTAKHSGKAVTLNTPEEGGLQQRRYANRPTQQWKLEAATPVALIPAGAVPSSTPSVGANQLSVYPNPSNGVMQMSYQLGVEQPLGWVLYNQSGIAVRVSDYRRQTAGGHHQTLDFRSLPAGDYYLNLTVGTINTKHPVSIRRPAAEAPATTAAE